MSLYTGVINTGSLPTCICTQEGWFTSLGAACTRRHQSRSYLPSRRIALVSEAIVGKSVSQNIEAGGCQFNYDFLMLTISI